MVPNKDRGELRGLAGCVSSRLKKPPKKIGPAGPPNDEYMRWMASPMEVVLFCFGCFLTLIFW